MIFNSHNLRKILLTFFVLASSQFLHAQIKGLIIDKDSKLPIAFASVIYENKSQQKGVISDAFGKFEIQKSDVKSITISCLGYKQQTVLTSTLSNSSNVIIGLEISSHELQEVIVTPTDNPALGIIKEVLAKKDRNNFKNYDKYSYQCYVKTIIDLKLSSDAKDSLSMKFLEKKNKRAGFLSEHIIKVSKHGNKLENKIIAHKTSGFGCKLIGLKPEIPYEIIYSPLGTSVSLHVKKNAENSTQNTIYQLQDHISKRSNQRLAKSII